MAASWRRIDTWLAAYSPTDLALLNPPVQPDRLESLERVLGVPVPDDLAESLRCHDGAREWSTMLPEQSLLSAEAIAERWQMLMELAPDFDGFETLEGNDEPWWHPLWVPWAEEAGGDPHVLDLRPGADAGRLGWAVHDGCGDFSDAWPSLADYMHTVAEALAHGGGVRGRYPYLTPDGRLWWDDGPDCQTLHGKPLTAAPTFS
ncbi:hypothetical protein GCM10009741_61320 [Kribbella lupini]|uniref:Knr4/Smi1-like domain-containing protein n=1 Tax=Kribbella lupini TaxID=291602 RepID=A0ABN2C1H6_9ACTN